VRRRQLFCLITRQTMSTNGRGGPDVFTLDELARATGAPLLQVQAWAEMGAIRTLPVGNGRRWLSRSEAVISGRAILAGTLAVAMASSGRPDLFQEKSGGPRAFRTPLALSSSLHASLVVALAFAASLGVGRAATPAADARLEPGRLRLVYVALPGPGGGGGGGGARQQTPPPLARRRGAQSLSSPLPVRKPPELPRPVEIRPDPEPPLAPPEPLPPVEAPVVASAPDETDRAGIMEEVAPDEPSRGPGTGGGVGTGAGTGIGNGEGTGVGEGSGGGTGGGPYRPGSGITPPSLLSEVKPRYSEEARRLDIEGDVVMEIVVQRDGSVGDVRILEGLGHGLDEQAVSAVRRWRFSPAHRNGSPVDVLVEVAMEFKLR
jgi:periplasmic protein TonB